MHIYICTYILHPYVCTYTIYTPLYIHICTYKWRHISIYMEVYIWIYIQRCIYGYRERWGAGVETQKNVWGEIGEWGRVPFNETYAPLLSTIYDGAQGSLNFLKMVLDPSPPPLHIVEVNTLQPLSLSFSLCISHSRSCFRSHAHAHFALALTVIHTSL